MQIHELPTDTPTTDDYLPMDDGVSTRKSTFSGFDAGENPVTFLNRDESAPTQWKGASVMESGNTLAVLMNRASAMASNVRYLRTLIGTTALGTVAQTITGAISEILTKMGSVSMTTTATTITGAIKEINQKVLALPDFSSYQTPTTSWTTPTVEASSCTIATGGYFTEGKHVYLQMRLNLSATLAAGTNLQICNSLPHPSPTNGVLCVGFGFRTGNAFVNTSGDLYIRSPEDTSVTTTTNIYITGHYVTA